MTTPAITIASLEFLRYPMPHPPIPQMGCGIWPISPVHQAIRSIINAVAASKFPVAAINLHPETWGLMQSPEDVQLSKLVDRLLGRELAEWQSR